MALDYRVVKNWKFADIAQTYTEKDTILYALGVGLGAEPASREQLRFVYEKELAALPSMASVLGYPGTWYRDPSSTIDWVKVLHGEHAIRILKPLPARGAVLCRTRVLGVVDKGAGKGALIVQERTVRDAASGDLLVVMTHTAFARGDGGFSAQGGPSDPSPAPPPALPKGAPEMTCDLPTLPQAALIYRLCGDMNPLHADPDIAREAGFPRPILHGLCTYGVACHAILKRCCDYDPSRLQGLSARFSAPVFPGETIRTEIWRQEGRARFRCRVIERDVAVLDGVAEILP